MIEELDMGNQMRLKMNKGTTELLFIGHAQTENVMGADFIGVFSRGMY